MPQMYYLTDADRKAIAALLRSERHRLGNAPPGRGGHPNPDTQDHPSPSVHVAKIPDGGLDALVDDLPGRAECDIYQIVTEDGITSLEQVLGESEVVHNLSTTALEAHTWVLVHRDAFGDWVASSIGAGAESFLVQLIGKDYEGSGFIAYTWVRVTDSDDPPVTYATENLCGCNGDWPVYHERNEDIPVFPPASPIERNGSTASSEEPEGLTGTGTAVLDGTGNPGSWTGTDNVFLSDDTYATVSLMPEEESDWLIIQGFGFCLPSNATITDVTVVVESHASASASAVDTEVRLVINDVIASDNLATESALPVSDAEEVYSGAPADWGISLGPAQVTCNATFGVALRFRNDGAAAVGVYVDNVVISISFTPSGGIAKHSIVRVRRGAGNYYLMDQVPWDDIFRRTGLFDAWGEIAYHRYYDQNDQTWKDGEEVRLVAAQ